MMRRTGTTLGLALALLAGCGGDAPAPAAPQPPVPRHAEARVGDVTVRANALATMALDEAIAERYGLVRDEGTLLLLVGVRRGAEEAPMQADVTATMTDLRGDRRPVPMRMLQGSDPSGAPVLDYFGIVEATPPDTLRFDIAVAWPGGPGATLQLQHELRPD